jgi:hypothetical protein
MATTPTSPVPLLSFEIDTKPRNVIAIDGKNYELRRPDDLTIDASNALAGKLRTYGQLNIIIEKQGRLTHQSRTQLTETMADLCRLILAAPPAILKKMTPVMRYRVINVFLTLSLTNGIKAAKAMELSGQISNQALDAVLSGKTSSRSSAGSMGAIRSRGSRNTRSASSGGTTGSSSSSARAKA